MAILNIITSSRAGVIPVYTPCAENGDEFPNTGNEILLVKNDDDAPHTVSIITPRLVDGLAVADRTVVIPAESERLIGPFPQGIYNDDNARTKLTYSDETGMSIAVLRVGS